MTDSWFFIAMLLFLGIAVRAPTTVPVLGKIFIVMLVMVMIMVMLVMIMIMVMLCWWYYNTN